MIYGNSGGIIVDEFELYKEGNSIPEVSIKTGIPRSTLRFRFAKKGILRSRAEGICIASKKGLQGSGMRGKKRIFTDEHRRNMSKAAIERGAKSSKGVSKKPNGYLEITRGPNKGKGQHVVIMEQCIGRRLAKNECVHHKNEIRDDNRIDNLQLMTRSEHARFHINSRNNNKSNGGN